MSNPLNPNVALPARTEYNFSGPTLNSHLTGITYHGGEIAMDATQFPLETVAVLALSITGMTAGRVATSLYLEPRTVKECKWELLDALAPDVRGISPQLQWQVVSDRAFAAGLTTVTKRVELAVPRPDNIVEVLAKMALGVKTIQAIQEVGAPEKEIDRFVDRLSRRGITGTAAKVTYAHVTGLLPPPNA